MSIQLWGDMMERRNHPRAVGSHPALCFSDIYSSPKVATAVDLSMGGTRIETRHSLIMGERLQIAVAIHSQVIKCRGEVVHVLESISDRPKAGIRSEELSRHDKLYLRQYLSHLMEQPTVS